jgi:hypothetical protein
MPCWHSRRSRDDHGACAHTRQPISKELRCWPDDESSGYRASVPVGLVLARLSGPSVIPICPCAGKPGTQVRTTYRPDQRYPRYSAVSWPTRPRICAGRCDGLGDDAYEDAINEARSELSASAKALNSAARSSSSRRSTAALSSIRSSRDGRGVRGLRAARARRPGGGAAGYWATLRLDLPHLDQGPGRAACSITSKASHPRSRTSVRSDRRDLPRFPWGYRPQDVVLQARTIDIDEVQRRRSPLGGPRGRSMRLPRQFPPPTAEDVRDLRTVAPRCPLSRGT